MKIDLHCHILPKNWDNLKEKYGYGGFIRLEHCDACSANMMQDETFFRKVDHNLWDAEVRLKECDQHHVDVQVLSTVPVMFSYWAKPKDTLDLSRYLNDHIADLVRKYPKRYIGLGTLPMQDIELACLELKRCKDIGLVGVEIGTHINGKNLDHSDFFPFYEQAEKLNMSVFIHPWEMMAKERMENHWLRWLVGMPAETTLAMASLMMGGIVEKYPKLKFCFAHGGGATAATLGRLEHGFVMRPDLCQTQTQTPPSQLVKKLYVDSLVHSQSALTTLIDTFGANRIALGTDYPFPLGELSPGELIESMNLSTEVKEQMLSGTALEFLNLNKADYI